MCACVRVCVRLFGICVCVSCMCGVRVLGKCCVCVCACLPFVCTYIYICVVCVVCTFLGEFVSERVYAHVVFERVCVGFVWFVFF